MPAGRTAGRINVGKPKKLLQEKGGLEGLDSIQEQEDTYSDSFGGSTCDPSESPKLSEFSGCRSDLSGRSSSSSRFKQKLNFEDGLEDESFSDTTSRFFQAAATGHQNLDDEPSVETRTTRASRARDVRPGAHRSELPSPGPETSPHFFSGGFNDRETGLQKLHDHSAAQGWAWEISMKEPPMRRAGKAAAPASKASQNVVDRVGVFEGGRARGMRRREADGEILAEDTGVHAVWRPKKKMHAGMPDTALETCRDCSYCARVGPDSLCFCGFTFSEHPIDARLAGGNADGFAWKKSLGKLVKSSIPGFSFDEGHDGIPLMPCSKFRYMPDSPAQTSQLASCADAFRAGRGVPSELLHHGWYAKCRNCKKGHQEHEPETEMCPLAFDEKVGTGRYQSSWECVVCNLRWEDHETAFEIENEYKEKEGMSMKQRIHSTTTIKGAPRTAEGLAWGARASEVDRLLQENSHGLSGAHRDFEHYGQGWKYQSYKDQIQRENALFREQEAEMLRLRRFRGDDGITCVETTTAYKEGKGAMYGHGVGDERDRFDNFGRPTTRADLTRPMLPKVRSTGSLKKVSWM